MRDVRERQTDTREEMGVIEYIEGYPEYMREMISIVHKSPSSYKIFIKPPIGSVYRI